MTSRHPNLVRATALLVVVLAGLGLGNLLHQVTDHADGDHGSSGPSCAVCAASQHTWGDLAPQLVPVAPSLLPGSHALPTDATFPAPAERSPAGPRAPPAAA